MVASFTTDAVPEKERAEYWQDDVSHFGRAFKAAFGMTPRDWRRVGRAPCVARARS